MVSSRKFYAFLEKLKLFYLVDYSLFKEMLTAKKVIKKSNDFKKDFSWQTKFFTGIRPTGNLTVANFVGAVAPLLELQKAGKNPLVFVADMHAMTDKEPKVAKKFALEIVADYLALGLDPKKCHIFLQSSIGRQIALLTLYLMRHITIAELLRIPTLKDKLKKEQREENANSLLANYPVMMAADILIQKSVEVPVGRDQLPHIEAAKLLARRFNRQYGEVFPIPKAYHLQAINILSLRGAGKMSKTKPEGAIFLTDTPEEATKKIKKAETAFAGELTENLKSHIFLAETLAQKESEKETIRKIIKEHLNGKNVMKDFKDLFCKITQNFLKNFQTKRKEVATNKKYLTAVLEEGFVLAKANAERTLKEVKEKMEK